MLKILNLLYILLFIYIIYYFETLLIIQCNNALISDRKTITRHEGNIFLCWTTGADDAKADLGTVPTINLNQIGRIHNLDSS